MLNIKTPVSRIKLRIRAGRVFGSDAGLRVFAPQYLIRKGQVG